MQNFGCIYISGLLFFFPKLQSSNNWYILINWYFHFIDQETLLKLLF